MRPTLDTLKAVADVAAPPAPPAHPRAPKIEKPRRPMTPAERKLATALGRCRFVPGINTKRFAREMAALAGEPDAAITEAQATYLRAAVYRYRRQIPEETVLLAPAD